MLKFFFTLQIFIKLSDYVLVQNVRSQHSRLYTLTHVAYMGKKTTANARASSAQRIRLNLRKETTVIHSFLEPTHIIKERVSRDHITQVHPSSTLNLRLTTMITF